jgi:hypothetical protein
MNMQELSCFFNTRASWRRYSHWHDFSSPTGVTMPLTAYDASIALFVRGLTGLKAVLQKTEQHAVSHGLTEAELLGAQLASDMHNLATQVHWAAQGPVLATARLVGATPVTWADDAKSFSELQRRLDNAIVQLQAVSPEELEASLGRTIDAEDRRPAPTSFLGQQYLTAYTIPTFYFHLTCAYAIVRHRGVDVNKGDYLGGSSR